MVELAITLGLIFSLLSYEVFGLAAGGIVVPGYIALQLSQPDRLIGIILVSLSTYLIIKILGHYTFLYGRRQMVICLLVGCLLSKLFQAVFSNRFDFKHSAITSCWLGCSRFDCTLVWQTGYLQNFVCFIHYFSVSEINCNHNF